MDKIQMLTELKQMKANGAELPNGYHLMGEEKLEELYNQLKGETSVNTVAEKETVVEEVMTPQNPFNEEIVNVMLQKDPLNPNIKVRWFSINGVDLYFPVGKMAKMPRSYYELYLNSVASEQEAALKIEENQNKEV